MAPVARAARRPQETSRLIANDIRRAGVLCLKSASGESVTGMTQFTFVEFFAGGGMARAGLGDKWRCLFANDFDQKKVSTYEANWGVGRHQARRRRKPDAGGFARHSRRPRMGFFSLSGSFPCRRLSGPWRRTRQCPDPFGHVLAVLETDARPRSSWPRPANDRA